MVLALTISISCSDEDDEDGNDSDLVGTWEATEIDGEYLTTTTVTFNSDATGRIVSKDEYDGEVETFTTQITWSTNGNKLSIIQDDGYSETDTYSISGNKLTVSNDDGLNLVLTKK